MNALLQYGIYLVLLAVLAIPLGNYIGKVMNGERVLLSPLLVPCERAVYRLLHVDETEEMHWRQYAGCALVFSGISLLTLLCTLMLQGYLPWNPQGAPGMSWHLALNTAISFITNTNWQTYSAEGVLSSFSQAVGLTVQNFLSAAVGIAVLFALIRGFVRVQAKGVGNFWADTTRTVLYLLLPLSLALSLALVSQGVVQHMGGSVQADLLEPITIVNEDGSTTQVTQQEIILFPAASQVAPKQLGTNGGGVYGTNSAHPLENPTPLSNALELLSILLIPAALCFTFGRNVRDARQGKALFLAMFLVLMGALAVIAWSEQAATPALSQTGMVELAMGNMEGKELRFGIPGSATWTAFTTAASNGSVNAMHDSLTPLGGMTAMLLMQLGEVIFGGVGCGLYSMLGFVMLTVFVAGLMVGRTPEYLGKKIEPREMRMAVLVCLATPIAILVGSGIAAMVPGVSDSLTNSGAHGFSELLYAFSSAGGNNGSAFAGLNANTPFLNVSLGLVMLFARFVPMTAALSIAGSLAQKRKVAASAGTLSTCGGMFVFLLILVIFIIGALSFFPALSLGPIAEHTQMLPY